MTKQRRHSRLSWSNRAWQSCIENWFLHIKYNCMTILRRFSSNCCIDVWLAWARCRSARKYFRWCRRKKSSWGSLTTPRERRRQMVCQMMKLPSQSLRRAWTSAACRAHAYTSRSYSSLTKRTSSKARNSFTKEEISSNSSVVRSSIIAATTKTGSGRQSHCWTKTVGSSTKRRNYNSYKWIQFVIQKSWEAWFWAQVLQRAMPPVPTPPKRGTMTVWSRMKATIAKVATEKINKQLMKMRFSDASIKQSKVKIDNSVKRRLNLVLYIIQTLSEYLFFLYR